MGRHSDRPPPSALVSSGSPASPAPESSPSPSERLPWWDEDSPVWEAIGVGIFVFLVLLGIIGSVIYLGVE